MKQLQTYNRYSQFIEMFGDFNNPAWRELRFVEFATVDVQMTTDFSKYADYPHIGIDVIEQNTGNIVGYRTVSEDGVKSGKYIFTPNHIIYSKIRPNLNKVATPSFFGLCSADAYPILPKEEVVRKEFLAMVLRSHVFLNYIIPFSQRTGMPKVNRVQVEGFTLRMPPLSEQDKFLAISRQADKSKFGGFKSQFIEMFGNPINNTKNWKISSLKDACVLVSDGPFGSNLKSCHYVQEGVRVIRLQNICQGQFNDTDRAYISNEHYKTLKKYTCNPGEIVIATLGEPNLRACIIPDYIKLSINKADCIHVIPKSDRLNPVFVCSYFNSTQVLHLATSDIHGTTRARIAGGQVANFPVFLPPIKLQEEFAAIVRQADKSKLIA